MEDPRKKAINLYKYKGWEKFLSNFKFWEEPYEIVEKMLPEKAFVVDLGCGEGLLSNYLSLAGSKRKILGFELDGERLKRARKNLKNTSFKLGDIVKIPYPAGDVFILFHVLHHLSSFEAQAQVLEKIKKSLKPSGKLIIVDVFVEPSIKYLAAWIADHFLVPWVFEKSFYTKAYFRKKEDWLKLLKNIGFRVKVTMEVSGRPFPNIIFECFPKNND